MERSYGDEAGEPTYFSILPRRLADRLLYSLNCSTDCKNTLIAILATLEHLLGKSWSPRRTIGTLFNRSSSSPSAPQLTPLSTHTVLAFGMDEEIGGPQGASSIGPYLLETYGENGVAMLVDEGGSGVEERYGKTFLLPGTGEKGNVSPTISVQTAGGHSYVSLSF